MTAMTRSKGKSIIQAKGLTKYYGAHLAVDDISFSVQQGEILGLLGPNGAGKSTTIRMITGYLRPSAGTITVVGNDILEEPLITKELIGYLPESAPIYPEMLAYEYLTYVARIRNIPESEILGEIRRVAGLCGLNPVMHQAFNELSRGYRQRVGLAHAIIGDPEILILDEPTSGLDPNQIVEIRSFIKDIGRKKTVIFSSHILSEVEAICDRILIIHQGQIAADSTPAALKRSMRGTMVLVVTLENARFPDVQGGLLALGGVSNVERVTDRGSASDGSLTVRIVCNEESRRDVYRRIRSADWIIMELQVEQNSMEDAFREFTGHSRVKGKIDGR
jgi:ABC-2 type transport system ATP-binding protein